MALPMRWPTKVGVKGLVRAHVLGACYVDEPFPETWNDFSRLVGAMGVTCIGSSPFQLRRLLSSSRLTGWWLPRLRILGTAGAPISPGEIRQVREGITENFHVGYGATEVGLIAHLGPEDEVDAGLRLVPGMECESIDEDGTSLTAGQPGRLKFRAPWMPGGYAFDDKATGENFRDGWFVSGDFGSVDSVGGIRLRGRIDDVINFGGAKVIPLDVERELKAHPGVADAAVIGVPDFLAGEKPMAFVVARPATTIDDIYRFLSARLEQWEVPQGIVLVGEIPRNPDGKVLKSSLRDIYANASHGDPASRSP
jgi:acyl-coenzyme A synthetase/AMP-(fatty) acid ligase